MDDMTDTDEFPVLLKDDTDTMTDRAGGLLKGETLMSSIVRAFTCATLCYHLRRCGDQGRTSHQHLQQQAAADLPVCAASAPTNSLLPNHPLRYFIVISRLRKSGGGRGFRELMSHISVPLVENFIQMNLMKNQIDG